MEKHLRLTAALLFLLITSSFRPVQAAEGKLALEVRVEIHHEQQWTKVFEGKDGWYCATEHNPMYPLERKPASLELFKSGESLEKNCRGIFMAKTLGKKPWSGCTNESSARDFLKALSKECGRSL